MDKAQFRKKPVVIEAIQWTGDNADPVQAFLHDGQTEAAYGWVIGRYVEIGTLEGTTTASIGDWIIRGVKGECYPCKPDIFAATYEPADQSSSASGERELIEALDRMDALLDPKCGLLAVSDSSGTVQASRCGLALIRAALAPSLAPSDNDWPGPCQFCGGMGGHWEGCRAPIQNALSPGIDAAEPKPVAYLDLGAGGYIDLGSDLSDDQLATLPKGRHMLSIIGTYGVDGYSAAPPAAQPSAEDPQFPFYELRFIMRVLGHKGSAPKEDWQTAYGMTRLIFERWSKDRQADPAASANECNWLGHTATSCPGGPKCDLLTKGDE